MPLAMSDIKMDLVVWQPRPQGLLAFQYGRGRREDPGTQRTKTIADWCIPLRVHTCALIGLFLLKQRWLPYEGFVEAEKCFFSVCDLKGGQNSGLIVRKTVTVPLEGKDSNVVISEMVIAGNVITRRGISVPRAIWFVCSKLLKICFFNVRFVKEYFQGFSLSINLAVRLQRFSIVLPFVFFEQKLYASY